ncbi:MAG: hypothetical protein ACLGHN_15270 [Bacteriovoracia bacterium]
MLSIKLFLTAFVGVLIPVYWKNYGPGNFLWFSDIGLFLSVLALWMRSSLIISIIVLTVLPFEIFWNIDFFFQLIAGNELTGLAAYMFDQEKTKFLRGLSLFHVFMPPIWIWCLYQWGYDRRAFRYAVALGLTALTLSYLLTKPEDNINWVYMPAKYGWTWISSLQWLLILLVTFPTLIYWPLHRFLTHIFHVPFILLLLSLFSCTTTIVCPKPNNGVSVSIIDHGRHASLLMQANQDEMVRYAYGDWKYFALRETGLWSGARALLWPTQAGLGRKVLKGNIEDVSPQGPLNEVVEEVLTFKVEKKRADRFREEMEKIYWDNIKSKYDNEVYGLEFVHHPEPYSLASNSNLVLVQWLERLGCEGSDMTFLSKWEVQQED